MLFQIGLLRLGDDSRHPGHEMRVRLEVGLQSHHSVFLHHGTDGCNPGFVRFGGIRYAINQDFGARPKLLQLVFQHIETDLQVLGIHDIKERHARSGGAVQGYIDPALAKLSQFFLYLCFDND